MKLLTLNNTKILKGLKKGYLTAGLHLLPGATCSKASSGCMKSCLNISGHGQSSRVQKARARKTAFFWEDLNGFLTQLNKEIAAFILKAEQKSLTPALRLNLTGDIPWECYGVPQQFPNCQFYCYTKYHERHPPENYHLTFSRSEDPENWVKAERWLDKGGNVAIVFRDKLPNKYWGVPVINGDKDDLRFLDPKPVIVGLTPKGRAKHDKTGFVVD